MKHRIALAGNPNVGKSTIFNALTGLHQHTGNWPGKTVACTTGYFSIGDAGFSIVDLPGIYSFDVRSEEEAITRDYIADNDFEFLLLVCDATCLERGLYLLKQVTSLLENRSADACPRIILCVNLCDEAEKKGIHVNFAYLGQELGIPVASCRARQKQGLTQLKALLYRLSREDDADKTGDRPSEEEQDECREHCNSSCPVYTTCSLASSYEKLPRTFMPKELAASAVTYTKKDFRRREERLDRILTGPVSGGIIMCLLLTAIFWMTITGANYPSSMLWNMFFHLETRLVELSVSLGLPQWFIGSFIYGVYRVVAWIISVMLPPMAIFFPLFTLLEDLGYLPRVAFNMDGAFHKCKACGKQCLTMAMGLGCNAAGVVGCRIIDSPRERLIAILTNSLVPCNGRFPLLLMMISLFLMGNAATAESGGGAASALPWLASLFTALALTGFILAGVLATLGASWLLSRTLLKGVPSSFTLELPPYRRPQVGKVIVRSIFDRTLFVLGRAVVVAAPAGLIIWLMANITIGGSSLLFLCSDFLEPLGNLMGLDGIILMAFILGFPANEIVLPIILMAYLQTGYLVEMDDSGALVSLLISHGWTIKTAVCMAIFSLFHWPCSTTCLTIKKETGSLKWTAVALLLPTCIGILLCILASSVWNLFL